MIIRQTMNFAVHFLAGAVLGAALVMLASRRGAEPISPTATADDDDRTPLAPEPV